MDTYNAALEFGNIEGNIEGNIFMYIYYLYILEQVYSKYSQNSMMPYCFGAELQFHLEFYWKPHRNTCIY